MDGSESPPLAVYGSLVAPRPRQLAAERAPTMVFRELWKYRPGRCSWNFCMEPGQQARTREPTSHRYPNLRYPERYPHPQGEPRPVRQHACLRYLASGEVRAHTRFALDERAAPRITEAESYSRQPNFGIHQWYPRWYPQLGLGTKFLRVRVRTTQRVSCCPRIRVQCRTVTKLSQRQRDQRGATGNVAGSLVFERDEWWVL